MAERIRRARTRRLRRIGGRTTALITLIFVAGIVFAVSAAAGGSGPRSLQGAGTCTSPDTLAGSKFEIDSAVTDTTRLGAHAGANLVLNSSACIDWLTTATGVGTGVAADRTSGVVYKRDFDSGSGDDSFSGGTSEGDNPWNPVIKDGSIPPNKSDLKTFGLYKETESTNHWLVLFWSRVNSPSGTTDMDFELNQKTCKADHTDCTFNSRSDADKAYEVPVRTVGDKLITYDLANGGVRPTISVYTWSAAGWGTGTVISGGNSADALGAINFSPIAANDSGGLGAQDPLTFGEVAINFNAIFGSGTCETLGSVYLKSRSSNTFTDELKDFIAPQTTSITNCGSVLVKKRDAVSFAALDGATFHVSPGSTDTSGNTATSTNLTAKGGGSGLYCAENLLLSNNPFTVTEDTPPPNHDLPATTSQQVTVTSQESCAVRFAKAVPDVDVTFDDPPALGAIQITKTGKDKSCTAAGSGCAGAGSRYLVAVFDVKNSSNVSVGTITTTGGVGCLAGLPFGGYTLHETTAGTPTGYQAPASDATVTLTAKGDCTSGYVNVPIVNIPLTTITVSTNSLAGAGVTESTVKCASETTAVATPHTTAALVPGEYTCTIVIDP
jgi:hypothetical protein